MAFDVLYCNGRDLSARPLRDRRARLEDVVAESDLVFPVRRLAPDGLKAWARVIERGYEGFVTKDESSPTSPAVRVAPQRTGITARRSADIASQAERPSSASASSLPPCAC
jgi:ATP dependent DNA ligase domain